MQVVSFEADQAALVLTDPTWAVVPIVAVHGAQVPWGKVVMNGVPVVAARRLPSRLGDLPSVLGPERVADLANQARNHLHPAACPSQRAGWLSVLLLVLTQREWAVLALVGEGSAPGDRRLAASDDGSGMPMGNRATGPLVD
jgi:hypothetical protein